MFEKPGFFWFFGLIPIIIIFLVFDILVLRKKAQKIAGKNIDIIIPYYSEGQKWLKVLFYTFAFMLTILALARPKWDLEIIDTRVKGRDILFLLDVSYSMAAIDQYPNRLEAAKKSIDYLLENESGDRFGLIVFSGKSELITPITHDYGAVSFFLDSIYPGMLGKNGTNIGSALINAINTFEDEGINNKVILLITDGENLQGDIAESLKKIKEYGIKIYTTGIGTKSGKPIPIINENGEISSFIHDLNDNIVISKLDEKNLKEIAKSTGGEYLGLINKKDHLVNVLNKINIEIKDQKNITYEQKKDQYDLFLIPALILFCLGFILGQGKLFPAKSIQFDWLFKQHYSLLPILIILPLFSGSQTLRAVTFDDKNQSDPIPLKLNLSDVNGGYWGNKAFKSGNYQMALEKYLSAFSSLKGENLARLNYNIANVYYQLGDYKKANQYYENAIKLTIDDKLITKILYNQGLSLFKNRNYREAAEMFKQSLKYDDKNDDARYNYSVARLLNNDMENQQKKSEKKEGNPTPLPEKTEKPNDNNDDQQLSKENIEKFLKTLSEKEKKENRDRAFQEQNDNSLRDFYW